MKFVLRSAVALSLLCVSTAAADPVTVTTGMIVFTDEPGVFQISGSGFEVNMGWFPIQLSGTPFGNHCASGCVPGTAIDFGTTTYAFSDFHSGGSVNGQMFPQLFPVGELTFKGPKFIAPSSDAERPYLGIAQAPFTFHGSVAIFADELHSGSPLFAEQLTGSGTATVFGTVLSAGNLFLLEDGDDVHFAFSSPVPEPSTLVMLVSGLIGAAAAANRRRRSGGANG